MAKQYKLMKVEEGIYNVRRSSNDEVIGYMNFNNGTWDTKILGHICSFNTKEKAQGFIRGVFTAQSDPAAAIFSQAQLENDYDDAVVPAADKLILALNSLKGAIEDFAATL